MNNKSYACLALCAGALLASAQPPRFQIIPRTNAIVRIDGRDITKRDVERDAKMFMTLRMNKARRMKVSPTDRDFFRTYCKRADQVEISDACYAAYARAHGLTNSVEVIARITKQFEKRYGAYSKKLKRHHTLNDLKYMFGRNASRLDALINSAAMHQTVTNHILSTNPVVITDDMIKDRISEIANANKSREATNAWVYAHATNVWHEIANRKLTFEQAATNYSQDAYLSMGCEWGTFSRESLSDEKALLDLLPTLKRGDITPPIESDCGLAILRIDEIDENGSYTFSRVFFRLPVLFDLETAEQARSYLIKESEQKRIRSELDAVRAKMKIEYPSGTNLFEKGSAPMKITKEDLAD